MKKGSGLSNEDIRKEVLEFLNRKRLSARSLNSVKATITDIKKDLKSTGISQSEVVLNLDYLVQSGWVKEEIETKTFKTNRGFEIPSDSRYYRLSEPGIKYFEGDSIFDRASVFSGINITNIGGVTVVGNNNVVRNEYLAEFKALDNLENAVKLSGECSDEQKLNAVADIRTIKDQLSKPSPNKSIIKEALDGLMFLSSIPGLIDLFTGAQNLIGKFF